MAQRLTMDAAGRIVIPAGVRRRLMLERGGSFTLTEDGLRLVLEPLVQEPETEERDGFLIFTGTLDGPVPDHRDLRDEHLDRKAALSRT